MNTPVRLAGWKSEKGRLEYLAAYRRALELWEPPVEDLEIPTRFGPTHALVSGPSDGAPLVLLHSAFNIGAVQWYPDVVRLSATRRVVALDFVGAPGLSRQTAPILNRTDAAAWLADVLDGLGVDRADLVGSSQGGWLALNLAVAEPPRVARLALLAPAAALQPFKRAVLLSLRAGPFMPGWTARSSLRPVFGGRYTVDDRLVDLLAISLRHYRFQQRPLFPDVFSDDELRAVTAATLVMIGDKEIVYDPVRALERAQALIPNVDTELVINAGHLPNLEQPELIDQRLLALFGST